ncbi:MULTISPECIES: c-type cytochrome [unclassified Sphingopyxis]|uniref:c-type cytochrome n=1 Tax=unclassified Sphingopyxis TaxID=2614943 RepID=UPI0024ACAAF8|nr:MULTISPECIES: c-type cytochrome [unclassified Sphingopyxis]
MDNAHIGKFRLAFLTGLVLAGTAACSKPAEENGTAGAKTSAETPAPAPAAAPDTYAALAADAGQVEAGKKLFSNCAVCHSVDPATPSPAGPQLIAVVGRQIGGAAGFPYSQALANAGGVWTPEKLDAFLKDPMTAYPGTAMAFGGLAKESDRKAIIAYLASIPAK